MTAVSMRVESMPVFGFPAFNCMRNARIDRHIAASGKPDGVTSDESRHDHHQSSVGILVCFFILPLNSKHQHLPNDGVLRDVALFFYSSFMKGCSFMHCFRRSPCPDIARSKISWRILCIGFLRWMAVKLGWEFQHHRVEELEVILSASSLAPALG